MASVSAVIRIQISGFDGQDMLVIHGSYPHLSALDQLRSTRLHRFTNQPGSIIVPLLHPAIVSGGGVHSLDRGVREGR